jgi:hypothetical protein
VISEVVMSMQQLLLSLRPALILVSPSR